MRQVLPLPQINRLPSAFWKLVLPLGLIVSTVQYLTSIAVAVPISIDAAVARKKAIDIYVAPGRATRISFKDGEVITSILPGDSHRFTYLTNLPLESLAANHIILRQVNTPVPPGATVSATPNLLVITAHGGLSGEQAAYEFNIHLNSGVNRGAEIVGAVSSPQPIAQKNTWNTRLGEAQIGDLELGLTLALNNKEIKDQTLIVALKEFMAQIRNGINIRDAALNNNVPTSIIDRLAEKGIKEFYRRLSNQDIHSSVACAASDQSCQNTGGKDD